jgi:hypothetical protein
VPPISSFSLTFDSVSIELTQGDATALNIKLERFQNADQTSIFATISPTPATAPVKSMVSNVQYQGGEALRVDHNFPANGFLEIGRSGPCI